MVLRRIRPSLKERNRVEELIGSIVRNVRQVVEKRRIDAEVRLDGSVAKDTWLSRQVDADVFLRLPTSVPKDQLRAICIPVAREALHPAKIIERYAEHPYAEAYIEELRVNIVPCYNVRSGEWNSATDRSPFHTEYIRTHLRTDQRDHVRLLKAFMTGIGTYGADIKTGGFSGMLCETLVAAYGSFRNVLGAASAWKRGTLIDVEGYYRERAEEVRDIFADDLIVIDPVDKGRNLAASVTRRRLWEFVSASREFLRGPTPSFFFPAPRKALTSRQIARIAEGRNLVALRVGRVDAVVDILWSQLYRTENTLSNHLRGYGFEVVRSASWSNENDLNVIVFEVAVDPLGRVYAHYGPETFRKTESARFLEKRLASADAAAGPWINGDRWVMMRIRKKRRAIDVLNEIVKSPRSQQLGVARRIVKAAQRTGRVCSLPQLITLARRDKAFASFLTDFITGRPRWLKN